MLARGSGLGGCVTSKEQYEGGFGRGGTVLYPDYGGYMNLHESKLIELYTQKDLLSCLLI